MIQKVHKQCQSDIQNFHSKLVNNCNQDRFTKIYDSLAKKTQDSEQILLRKASEVEQLVLRLALDELNELGRAQN